MSLINPESGSIPNRTPPVITQWLKEILKFVYHYYFQSGWTQRDSRFRGQLLRGEAGGGWVFELKEVRSPTMDPLEEDFLVLLFALDHCSESVVTLSTSRIATCRSGEGGQCTDRARSKGTWVQTQNVPTPPPLSFPTTQWETLQISYY